MFDYYYMSRILSVAQNLPKEFIYAAAAGLTVNEIHKRYTQMKLEEIKASAKARELELEVEKLRLQIDLRDAKIDTP